MLLQVDPHLFQAPPLLPPGELSITARRSEARKLLAKIEIDLAQVNDEMALLEAQMRDLASRRRVLFERKREQSRLLVRLHCATL